MPANTKGSTEGRIIKTLCESLTLLLGAVEPPEDLLQWRDTIKQQLTPELPFDRMNGVLRSTADFVMQVQNHTSTEQQASDTFMQQLSERLRSLDKLLQGAGQQPSLPITGAKRYGLGWSVNWRPSNPSSIGGRP